MAAVEMMIVDDDVELADLLRLQLEAKGFECKVAYNGTQAIQMYQDNRPAIILLDVNMPGIDGFVVARKIRGQSGSKTKPNIIMLTTKHSSEDVLKALENGANDYAVKPVQMPLLLDKIKKAMAAI